MNNALAMGIYDDLDQQTQPLLTINLLKDNVIIFGNHMSGKTTFLKTLLVRLHETAVRPCEIYVADFGGNLGDYADMNMMAACFNSANEENIRRIFKTLESKIEKNSKILKSSQFTEVYFSDAEIKPMHLILIIDNVNSFLTDERYESYQETLLKLCRDGLSKGLTVIFSATDTANGLSRYLTNFGQKIAFDLSPDKYMEVFGFRIMKPMKKPGRGVANVAGKVREFQCFLPFGNEKKDLPEFLHTHQDESLKAEKLCGFDQELTQENLVDYIGCPLPEESHDIITVGLDYYHHFPVSIHLKEIHSIAIYGKKKFGKTNLLKLLVSEIHKKHPNYRFILFDDGRKQLDEIEITEDNDEKSESSDFHQEEINPIPTPASDPDPVPPSPEVDALPPPLGSNPIPPPPESDPIPPLLGSNPIPSLSGSDPFPPLPGSNPIPSPSGSDPFPPLPGSNPIPSLSGSDPFPPLPGSNPIPSPSGSDPFPPLPGSNPIPSLSGSDPFPPLPGSNPIPSPSGSDPFPPLPGSNPIPSPSGSDPFPPLPGSSPISPLSESNPIPPLPGSNPIPSLSGSDPFPPLPGSNPIPPLPGSNPIPPLSGSNPIPPLSGSNPIPPPSPSNPEAEQNQQEKKPSLLIKVKNLDELGKNMEKLGYLRKSQNGLDTYSVNKDLPSVPTIFILQNKMLFQSAGKSWIKIFSDLAAVAEEKNIWIIYSDVKKIGNNDRDTESQLNNSIAVAFLLDNIAEFITDRGSRSVFGEMDIKELKSEYAKCEVGDGYYYDIEGDDLKKMKFIKV